MSRGDFELLSTYISVHTRGAEEVIKTFQELRGLTRGMQRVNLGAGMEQAAGAADEFREAINEARLDLLKIAADQTNLVQSITQVEQVQRRVRDLLRQQNLSTTQQIAAYQQIRAAQRQAASAASALARAQSQAPTQAQAFSAAIRDAQLAFLQIQGSAGDAAQQIQDLADLQRQVEDILNNQTANVDQQIRAQRLLNQILARTRTLQGQIAIAQAAQNRQAQANVAAGVAAFGRGMQQLSAARQQMRQALNSISLEVGFVAPFLRTATNAFRVAGAFRQIAQAAGASRGAIVAAGVAGTAFTYALRALQGVVSLVTIGLQAMARVVSTTLRNAFTFVMGPTVQFIRTLRILSQTFPLVIAGMTALASRTLINVAGQMQRIESSFQFAFGPGAAAQLQYITQLAQRMGVPLQTVAENYSRISAAARDAGITQRELQTLFEGTSSAAVALGLDAERVGGLFFAFEQIISKGVLSAEELRRQIGDRLPGAFNLAARALGVTTQRLDQLLEQGAIRSDVFIRAIGRELQRTFGPAALNAAQRLTASLARMRNTFFLMTADIAQRLEPAMVGIINRISSLGERLSQTSGFRRFTAFLEQQLQFIERNFNRMVDAAVAMAARVGPALERLGRVMLVLNTVAIGALVEGFARLFQASGPVVSFLERMATAVTGIRFDELETSVASFVGILENIPLMFDLIGLRVQVAGQRVRQFFQEQFPLTLGLINLFRRLGEAEDAFIRKLHGLDQLPAGEQDAVRDRMRNARTEAGREITRLQNEIQQKLAEIQGGIARSAQEGMMTSWERAMVQLAQLSNDTITTLEGQVEGYRRIWREVGGDITGIMQQAFTSVRARAGAVFRELMAGFRGVQAQEGPGMETTSGGGGRLTVLARESLINRNQTEAATTARNTSDLVALTRVMKDALVTMPAEIARHASPIGALFPSVMVNK